ncbi:MULTISPECIES: hypothetical protein [Petrotoga]|jgi:hypothetical protein|uniref:hypothetical protein n=1 Tax=Petrotoga TaxID=28236 RepID=UPI0002FA1FBB|nr:MULTISPECIES: hypothetical protein [Petrotoga]PNR94111.1 hypothetical protein X926_01140 [Petrotoga sp. HWHPT.55.6.3]
MSKPWLMVVGIYIVLMAIVALTVGQMPAWRGTIDIILGLIALIVAFMDKGKKGSAA